MTATREPRSSLGHLPDGKWEFDAAVTAVFDDMARRSIPLYDDFHRFAVELARPIVRDGSAVLDVGCSTGALIRRLRAELGCNVVGLDESEAMVVEARARFDGDRAVAILQADVTRSTGWDELDRKFGGTRFDAAFAILTLMFIPPTARLSVLAAIAARTNPGGVLVVVEKTYARDARNEETFRRLYHDFKERAGYSRIEIERKAESLAGVLRPWTVDATAAVLEEAGFRAVEVFAKWGPFAGLVASR